MVLGGFFIFLLLYDRFKNPFRKFLPFETRENLLNHLNRAFFYEELKEESKSVWLHTDTVRLLVTKKDE